MTKMKSLLNAAEELSMYLANLDYHGGVMLLRAFSWLHICHVFHKKNRC